MNIFKKIKQLMEYDKIVEKISQLNDRKTELNLEIESLNKQIEDTKNNRDKELKITEEKTKAIIEKYKTDTITNENIYNQSVTQLNATRTEVEKAETKLNHLQDKAKIFRKLFSVINRDFNKDYRIEELSNELNLLCPTVELHLHTYDIKRLKQLSKDNNDIIDKVLEKYESRYTTKSNKAIYQLMVLSLRSELQNILNSMKYSNIDVCIENYKNILKKYLTIASDGSQTIAPTLTSFINEIEVLFEKTIQIEYEYYIQKEREKQEQQAIREQMKQEAEERRELERQQKQVEKEEEKYKSEINNLEEQILKNTDNEKISQLQAKIAELKAQLQEVETKKEEIINRQNGKAGYVYVISNLGSFGENTFKIGMTRRLEPMDRIKELGDASVPFSFDVHSFIFSEDAVSLEHKLHTILNDKRKNKVNLRKEFFDITIDELEQIVYENDPSAEFNKTMIAHEYRRTKELSKI